jgi:hypothetical protein
MQVNVDRARQIPSSGHLGQVYFKPGIFQTRHISNQAYFKPSAAQTQCNSDPVQSGAEKNLIISGAIRGEPQILDWVGKLSESETQNTAALLLRGHCIHPV